MTESIIHVLLVDDDPAHARLASRACAKTTYTSAFTHVTTGEECIELLRTEPFDVVLLDYSLPRQNGLEVLAQIKALESSPPVIIVTGHGDEQIAVEAMKLGASDYLVKSVDLSHFEIMPLTILKAVEGHRTQMERQQLEGQLIRSEKFAAIGELASHVAHEIRNPLSSMELNLDLLAEEIACGAQINVQEAQDLLKAVHVEVERLDDIVSEYLAFARLPGFQFEMESLNTVIQAFCKFVEPQLYQAHITLKTDLDADLPDILLDAEQIQQALHNFFKNAIEAMPKGGTLSVHTSLESDQILLRISDTGQGIPQSDLQRIYDPFFTTKKGGTGLGLPLTQEIITQHQGRIRCDSTPGKGTRFTITLPIRQAGEEE